MSVAEAYARVALNDLRHLDKDSMTVTIGPNVRNLNHFIACVCDEISRSAWAKAYSLGGNKIHLIRVDPGRPLLLREYN